MSIQWRKFPFFDKTLVSEPNDENKPLESIKKLQIQTCCSGRGKLIFGDIEGFIHVYDSNFHVTSSFRGYMQTISNLKQMKSRNILLGIGTDEEELIPTLKIWDQDRGDKNLGPLLCKSIKITSEYKQSGLIATTLCVLEDLSTIAVGLMDGSVFLISGTDLSRDRFPKAKIIKKPTGNPITGLGFRQLRSSLVLFASDMSSVNSMIITPKDIKFNELEVDAGAEMNCTCVSEDSEFIVGRNEVYFYEPEGRGQCLFFEGKKKYLYWFREYLLVITQSGEETVNTVNVYNTKHKFIAYNLPSISSISYVLSEWGSIFVLTNKNEMYRLEEKDTETKLQNLIKRNLYHIAISLAKDQQYDMNSVMDIHRKFGDHLYEKGDFDMAMLRYVETIGYLEPSYVIRRFLDAQRTNNLTTYLQALHERGLASSDHTTLLLNCYTKLKEVKKLNEFIKGDNQKLNFEVETAIKVCRQAGYHEQALYLAQTHGQHELFLKILLENLGDYSKAIEYISSLNHVEAEKNMKKYGKILINSLPEQTTRLLMDLCTNYIPKKNTFIQSTEQEEIVEITPSKTNADEFIHIFVNQEESLVEFLEFITKNSQPSPLIYNTLLELYLRFTEDQQHNFDQIQSSKDEKRKGIFEKKAVDLLMDKESKYDENHALVLCQTHDFQTGILYLYEKMQLFNELMQYHMEKKMYGQVVETAKKFGSNDPYLWVQALTYFAGVEEDCQSEIREVLKNIDEENLLPPLRVISILSEAKKKTCTLSVIKDYIVTKLQKENEVVEKDKKEIEKLKEETKKMKEEIEELKTQPRIFQLSKCASCNTSLDIPAVHFHCSHSYHHRCLYENDNECPKCSPSYKHIIEVKHSLEKSANEHEQFFKKLEGSNDGFLVVAEYFGRGLFNPEISTPTTGNLSQSNSKMNRN